MSFSKNIYTVTEFTSFSRNVKLEGIIALPENTFDDFESFILNNYQNKIDNINFFFRISSKSGIGKIITVQNYVGVITINNNTLIEILPKVAGKSVTEADARLILLNMLRSTRSVVFKKTNQSNLDTKHHNLLEIYIQMFIEEITKLVKTGLRKDYNLVEENENFFKGKLNVQANIKYNLIHKERFYVSYDKFTINRPENRIIKSALKLLLGQTHSPRNYQLLLQLLSFFNEIKESHNIYADLNNCSIDRTINHYKLALQWAKIFLNKESFSPFIGTENVNAILFSMNDLFEDYIATLYKKYLNNNYHLKTQDRKFSLFNDPKPTFHLRPDMVISANDEHFILDTKWKLLSDKRTNFGITQADMYQMYAYSKKYMARRVFLIYPMSDEINTGHNINYSSIDNVSVNVIFIDFTLSN